MIDYLKLIVDLVPDFNGPALRMAVSQGDVGRPIQLTLRNAGVPYAIPEGCTVQIKVRKPSGRAYTNAVDYAAGTPYVYLTTQQQMTAEGGNCLLELSIRGDGQDPIGSANWIMWVEPDPLNNTDPSETWIYDVEAKLAELEEEYAAIEEIADHIIDVVDRAEAAAEAVEEMEPTVNDLSTRMTAAEGAITTAQGDIQTNAGDISSLDTRMTTAEGDISGNASDITALQGRMTTAEGNIQTNAGDISSLDTRMTDAEAYITALQTVTAILTRSGSGRVNSLYGGRDLGSNPADYQATIAAGDFDGLQVGDFWTKNGVEWLIIDADYAPNIGQHHLVIMPRWSLYQAAMNATNTAAGGYASSDMFNTNMAQAVTQIEAAFGSMVIEHSETLINATNSGRASGVANFTVKAVLPSTYQTIGAPSMEIMSNSSAQAQLRESYMRRFNLFNLRPDLVVPTDANGNRSEMWTRSNSTETYFQILNTAGTTFNLASTSSRGVRPYFFIG